MIIGLTAKARAGKDTFGEQLIRCFRETYGRGFTHMAFAKQLKNMCKEHFELSDNQLWERGKDIREKSDLRFPKRLRGLSSNPSDYWSPREIMQEFGSFYRRINYDYWVYALDKESKKQNYKDIIITDVRHINECEYVKNNKGILIKIVRDSAEEIHGMQHESEIALDDSPEDYFDIIINNNGTLDDLYTAAKNTVSAVILIEKMIEKGEVYNG